MAYRRVVRWAVDEAGNVIGGTGYEGRLYLANTSTLGTLKLDSAGSFACANPHSPNPGTQTSSSANMLTTDDTIAVLSSTGFTVADLVPIDGSAGRFYGVIRTIVDATHIQFTQTLAAMGGGSTMNSGALVGGPEMTGHWQAFVLDTSDYDFTLKNLATGKEGPPEGVATLSTAGTLAFQEEGVSTGVARPTLNFIGASITAADNAGSNRVDVTVAAIEGASYVTTAAESLLSNEKVLGTTVITKGTLGSRPGASTSGYLYFATDGAGGTAGTLGALYRDTGAAWDLVATNTAVDVQTFTGNGTWTKPTTFTPKSVLVLAWGGGGGGGAGEGLVAANPDTGGGGGGGGVYQFRSFDPSTLGATETVTIGGAGTAGVGAAGGAGSAGGGGGTTTFGAHISIPGGGGGAAGANGADANGGTAGTFGGGPGTGGAGGACRAVTGTGDAGSGSVFAGPGGGGGGACATSNTNFAGGAGGNTDSLGTGGGGGGGAAGGTAGTAGTSRSGTGKSGTAGGGGGGKFNGVGGAGGAGGAPCAGGGGGGTGTTGGNGGLGGRGEMLVYTFG